MKVDFSSPINGLDNKPVKEANGSGGSMEITMSSICCSVLLTQDTEEAAATGEEKVKRFKIAEKVYSGGEQDLSAEDIVLLKRLIGKFYGPLVVARAYDILEPKT
jgi:hypothetical protein